jgi:hypothetical protein
MMRRPWRVFFPLTGFICLTLLWSCAGRQYLIVDYTIPTATQHLDDQSVRLRIDDQREDRKIMSPSAAAKFQAFNDRYSLAWVTPDKGRILAGEHDLAALFQKAFAKRLALMGAITAPESNFQNPELAISLESFTIDLQGQKWVAEVAYSASLTQEGHPVTKEQIRGNAERIRIVGRKGADMVISDIFTEVVNRLDMVTLFRKAELIP